MAALADLKNTFSFRACSTKHNIPTTVLYKHFKFKEKYPNKGMKKQGGQIILSDNAEKISIEQLITYSNWGYPLPYFHYLTINCQIIFRPKRKNGKTVKKIIFLVMILHYHFENVTMMC